jgi:UPF0176 protein
MTVPDFPIRIVALYRFTHMADPVALRAPLAQLCEAHGVCGTLLLAPEGINGTIAGLDDDIDAVLAELRALPGCAGLDVKDSRAATMPFLRLKVRVKREIVTMGEPDIDPRVNAGTYVAPEDWNALIDQPDTIVIDTRNDYEVSIGSFEGAINPRTISFRDFPDWFRNNRTQLLDGVHTPKVAMFCTGGIRCEKATAFLKSEGVEQVYHLQGGILKYLEKIPEAQSKWQGECFVFDQRVSVQHALVPGSYDMCHACRMPLGADDMASPHYVPGISCPLCIDSRNDTQRAGYIERQRQMQLAKQRGGTHIGRNIGASRLARADD